MYGGTIGSNWPKVDLDAIIQNNPLNFIRSGVYHHHLGVIGARNDQGHYWLPGLYLDIYARVMYFYSTTLSPQNADPKGLGTSLRCLVSLEFEAVLPTPYLQWY